MLVLHTSLSCFQDVYLFLYRTLGFNQLTGTIPAEISALVELQDLWALTSVNSVLDRALCIFVLIGVGLVRFSLIFLPRVTREQCVAKRVCKTSFSLCVMVIHLLVSTDASVHHTGTLPAQKLSQRPAV